MKEFEIFPTVSEPTMIKIYSSAAGYTMMKYLWLCHDKQLSNISLRTPPPHRPPQQKQMKNEPSETNKSKYQIKLFIVLKQKQHKSVSHPPPL